MEELEKRQLKDPNVLRVFFSSPFGGMEEEREELTRKYFPQFQHACSVKGVQFVPVDMRWGITSEAAENAQVISICLRELDRSDVFVGFFGQRYGWHGKDDQMLQKNFDNAVSLFPWLDNVRDRSVTELEFLHGHLNNPGSLPVCISFRDKGYDDSIRAEGVAKGDNRIIYKYSAESDHSSKMMADLISRVEGTRDKTLGVNINYKTPQEGAKFMFESVFPTCLELLEGIDPKPLSPLEQDRVFHNVKIASLSSVYIEGEEYLEMLSIEHLAANPKTLILGPQGCGKSALLANHVKNLKDISPAVNIIYHFVGSGPGTADPLELMKRVLGELKLINHTEDVNVGPQQQKAATKLNEESYKIYTEVMKELEELSASGKELFLIIDSLNKVKMAEKTAKHLYWLPKDCPKGVSLIISTVDSDTATIDLLVKEHDFKKIEIKPLSQNAQKLICEETLKKRGKEFSPPQLQRVIDADQTKNPLFLKIFLGEVSIHGDFFLLDDKINSLIYSDGVKDLLNKVMKRLEDDYNVQDHPAPLVPQVLSTIAISHRGLSEQEIKDIFNIASHVWSPFYFAVEEFLITHGGLLRFSFTEIFETVMERYLNTQETRKKAILPVVDYLLNMLEECNSVDYLNDATYKRVALELPWLVKSLGDKQLLFKIISDVRIFFPLMNHSRPEIIDLWRETEMSADELCHSLLESYDNAIVNLYLSHEENLEVNNEPPGYTLLPLLTTVNNFFSEIHHHKSSVVVAQRKIVILSGLKGHNIREDVRVTLLRDEKYFLGTYYVDTAQYKLGQTILEEIKLECEKYLQTCDDIRAKQTLAYCHNGIGTMYMHQGFHSQSEECFLQSIEIHKKLGNEQSVADATQNIGLVKMNANKDPELAMEYFNKAMKMYERLHFGHLPLVVANLITNMAVTQRRMGNLDEAERLYLKSLHLKAQAVGWAHEVIAVTYMNLGTLEMHRDNFLKAEEYSLKALEIHEANEIDLKQNPMWQCLENLATCRLKQGKLEEALEPFQRVYTMLKQENKIYQGNPLLHKKMMSLLLDKEMFVEAIDVIEGYVASTELRDANLFKVLDHCYQMLPSEQRKPRPHEQTLEYAMEELWPGNNELTGYYIQTYAFPQNDVDKVIELLNIMDKMNPGFGSSTYIVGIQWSEMAGNFPALVRVAKVGLEKYPDDMGLKVKLFDGLRKLEQFKEAYPMIEDILKDQQDNQGLILVSGQVALMAGDLNQCKELWEKASLMPDENLASKAKAQLIILDEMLKQHENGETDNV